MTPDMSPVQIQLWLGYDVRYAEGGPFDSPAIGFFDSFIKVNEKTSKSFSTADA